MPDAPRNLDDLRAVEGDEEQVRAADAFLAKVAGAEREARQFRDEAIRRLAAVHGPSEAARRAGRSLTTVKAIIRGSRL